MSYLGLRCSWGVACPWRGRGDEEDVLVLVVALRFACCVGVVALRCVAPPPRSHLLCHYSTLTYCKPDLRLEKISMLAPGVGGQDILVLLCLAFGLLSLSMVWRGMVWLNVVMSVPSQWICILSDCTLL